MDMLFDLKQKKHYYLSSHLLQGFLCNL